MIRSKNANNDAEGYWHSNERVRIDSGENYLKKRKISFSNRSS